MNKTLSKPLLLLAIAPVLLAAVFLSGAVFFGMRNSWSARAVYYEFGLSLPYLLIINHTLLFALLLGLMKPTKLSAIGWRLPRGWKSLVPEALIGAAAGIALGLLNKYAVSPLIVAAGERFGDYAPLPVVMDNYAAWVVATTIFAGVAEESVYRGYALEKLQKGMSIYGAVLVSSLFFAVFHWAEGFWAMLTIPFDAALLCALMLWRRTLIVPLSAHAMVNIVGLTL